MARGLKFAEFDLDFPALRRAVQFIFEDDELRICLER